MIYEINLTKYKDPEIYKRNGKDCYFDSIKKILRPKTPEEIVRQKIIEYLIDEMGIPPEAMKTEVAMSHFKPGNRGRADIIVYAIDEEYVLPANSFPYLLAN